MQQPLDAGCARQSFFIVSQTAFAIAAEPIAFGWMSVSAKYSGWPLNTGRMSMKWQVAFALGARIRAVAEVLHLGHCVLEDRVGVRATDERALGHVRIEEVDHAAYGLQSYNDGETARGRAIRAPDHARVG